MCGRFAQQRPAAELAERFGAELLVDDPEPAFNVAPTDAALVIVQREDRRAIVRYRWGLVPHWAASAAFGSRAFNARVETVATAPAFRDSLRRRRCVVPVDAFYEWRRDGRSRQPFAFRDRDGEPLALAGLWAGWRDPEADAVRRTFTILTAPALGMVAALHDRMPIRLRRADWSRWLDPELADPSELVALLGDGPVDDLVGHPVGRLVNDVRNDGPELLEPLGGLDGETLPWAGPGAGHRPG